MIDRRTLSKTRDAIDTILTLKTGPAELAEVFRRCHVDGEKAMLAIRGLGIEAGKEAKRHAAT
jgi:hypothetical protein